MYTKKLVNDDIKYNRKMASKFRLIYPILIPTLVVVSKSFLINQIKYRMLLIEVIKVSCLYLSYLIIIPILHYAFIIFNDQQ